MQKQTLLYSITLNGQKTYILAGLDNPLVGINLLRPADWESYVSDVFQLTNPNQIVTLFNIQNAYNQYDPATHLVTSTGLNSYNLSSSDTTSIILREAITRRNESNQYAFNYIMSRSSYKALMAHNIIAQILLLMSINSDFLNKMTFRAWDRFSKACSLALSLLKETPFIKAIKVGIKLVRKMVTPRILEITFFNNIHQGLSNLLPLSHLRQNFPVASAVVQFLTSCLLYEYAVTPLLNFFLKSSMIPAVIKIAAPALIVSCLKMSVALAGSYYAAIFIMRALSAAYMLFPGVSDPVDNHLSIENSLLNRHYSAWTNWLFKPSGKDISHRLMHLDENIARPSFMGFILNNKLSRWLSDVIFRRILGYSNHFQADDNNVGPIARERRLQRPNLVVLPVDLLYGEKGLIKTLETTPGNDLRPCLIWSAPAAHDINAVCKSILEFDSIALMNQHLTRNGL